MVLSYDERPEPIPKSKAKANQEKRNEDSRQLGVEKQICQSCCGKRQQDHGCISPVTEPNIMDGIGCKRHLEPKINKQSETSG
jgi:hypothetical protein